MVRCFLIHTVCPVSALSAAESRVLYSRLFGPEDGVVSGQPRDLSPEDGVVSGQPRDLSPEDGVVSGQPRDLSPEDRRLLQKERVAVVARQIQSSVRLHREASGRLLLETLPGEETLALHDADSGVVRLRAGEPFPEEMSALWLAVQSVGFTLVCGRHDNLLQAEGTLRTLVRHCLEHLHMLGQGSEVLLRSNRVDVLLSRLLPHGQLLFLNHRFTQSLEKEVAAYMAK